MARIIMCSASQQSMVMDAIRVGARDFIVKPFQPDRVLEAVKRLYYNRNEGKLWQRFYHKMKRFTIICLVFWGAEGRGDSKRGKAENKSL